MAHDRDIGRAAVDSSGGQQTMDAPGALRWSDRLIVHAIGLLAGGRTRHRFALTLPSGGQAVIGASGPIEAQLTIRSLKALYRLVRRGQLGFAESYIKGEVDSCDLTALLRFTLTSGVTVDDALGGVVRARNAELRAHRSRSNTRTGSRRNIAEHYDLGNAFYSLWLDAGMTYSSGIFRDSEQTLEAAQGEKYRAVIAALDISQGDRVLEIGCGWGGFAEAAIQQGGTVVGLTLSREQLVYARARLATSTPAGSSDIRLEDYRDVTGTFDRIASIEMIEAVGEEHWPLYFATLHDRLRPGGVGVLQAITIRDCDYERYRREPDFIQRYIFPGGMLPTVALMRNHAEAAGLHFETVETFGASYAATLSAWSRRFEAAWPQIAALGFDDRFRRMWRYYLAYCQVGFEAGVIDVGLYRIRKP